MWTSELSRRLFAALWFAVAGAIPVGLSFLIVPMSSGKMFQIVTTSASILSAACCGCWLGAGILDETKTRSALRAAGRGLAIAGLSYLLLVVTEIIVAVIYNRNSGTDFIAMVYVIGIMFLLGLVFFGLLIAAVGAAAGGLLYLFQNKTVESSLSKIFLFLVGLTAFVSSAAGQDRNFAPDLVRQTRALKVSSLEKHMPPVLFEEWFTNAMGKAPSITWIVEDCGGGSPNFTGLDSDHRLCVVAEGVITDQLSAIVSIEYRKFLNGKGAAPELERITTGAPGTRYGYGPGELKELRKRVAEIKRSLVFVDPRDGEFFISDLEQWGGVQGMSVDTDKRSRGRFPNVWTKGQVDADGYLFPTLRNFYDGKRWSFETVTVHGISFKFSGKFEKTRLRENGDTENDHILKGHLTKFVKGKKAAEADLTFTFDPFNDAP
ncbi:MAG TPA: hypothetical protein VHQ01_13080 [Pyrinomonadaceae bacterium]|nr:hypothetical protein [Pyrinomonadaceae bacterium]